jgi:hypothetical protein
MKPKSYVRMQAAGVLLATLAILIVLGRGAALATAGALTLGLVIWVAFVLVYEMRRRRVDRGLSAYRAERDRAMVGCLVVGLLVPTTLAWFDALADVELVGPPVHSGQSVILALSVIAFPLSLLVSSSVDWYLIRPFREGVFGDPVCRASHEEGETMSYARYWILHRMISEFLVYAAVVGIVAIATVLAKDATDSENGKDILGLVGPLGIAVWSIRELTKLQAALKFVRYPTCGLGEWVEGRNAECVDISGFVLDVATDPGVQLIEKPRGHPARDISNARKSIPLSQRNGITSVTPPTAHCQGRCEFWVPDCEVGLREREAAASGSAEPPPAPASPQSR